MNGDLGQLNDYNPDRVDYARVIEEKYPILRKAYEKAKQLGLLKKVLMSLKEKTVFG